MAVHNYLYGGARTMIVVAARRKRMMVRNRRLIRDQVGAPVVHGKEWVSTVGSAGRTVDMLIRKTPADREKLTTHPEEALVCTPAAMAGWVGSFPCVGREVPFVVLDGNLRYTGHLKMQVVRNMVEEHRLV